MLFHSSGGSALLRKPLLMNLSCWYYSRGAGRVKGKIRGGTDRKKCVMSAFILLRGVRGFYDAGGAEISYFQLFFLLTAYGL